MDNRFRRPLDRLCHGKSRIPDRNPRHRFREVLHLPARILLVLALLATCLPALRAEDSLRIRGVIGPESPWATEWFEARGASRGPTVLVVGGVHGDEPAGARAAEAVACWPVKKGRLVVIPRANVRALAAGRRNTPGASESEHNLNRDFPLNAYTGNESEKEVPSRCSPKGDHARDLWRFVEALNPDWILDLHEGYGFRAAGSKSVGNSIIHQPHPETTPVAEDLVEAVNRKIEDPKKRFVVLRFPAKGSLVRAATEVEGARGMIVETCTKGYHQAFRARRHRDIVHGALTGLGMAACGPHELLGPRDAADPSIRVALYDDEGASHRTAAQIAHALSGLEGAVIRRLAAADVREGALDRFDVVIFGGGSGSGEARGLEKKGREAVREFVNRGGGYVGICAGAYLATSGYDWGLKILDAETVDRKHWKRGRGTVRIEAAEAGRVFFDAVIDPDRGEESVMWSIQYANGPLLGRAGIPRLPDFEVLARFRDELAENGAPKGVMIDTPAIVSGTFGKGRVICFSPHPEKTAALHPLLIHAVAWAGK